MPKFIKKRSKKIGMPPGTLVHIGEKMSERTKIKVLEYDEVNFQERELENVEECFLFKNEPTVTWVNVDGLHEVEILGKLGGCFGLHPLMTEDILNTDQRPKMEDYGEDLFIVLKVLSYDDRTGEISAEQVSLVLRSHALLSFGEKEGSGFASIQERIRGGKGRLRKMGVDYLAYTLLDIIVDNYFVILEKLGEKIEILEQKLVTNPTAQTLLKIQNLKREMLFLRKWIWPLREVLSGLERGESSRIQESTRFYLRDVYDHTIQVMDTIEIFRDMLSGMLDIYLSSVNNRMNAVVKVLTIIATIFMPLTFLAGVYGMNFKHMPELEWPWSYPVIWLFMILIAVFMVISFRKKKWL
ncbi:MAG: magnesium/cobalt transporter CorA [Pseudomonadota bacterium]